MSKGKSFFSLIAMSFDVKSFSTSITSPPYMNECEGCFVKYATLLSILCIIIAVRCNYDAYFFFKSFFCTRAFNNKKFFCNYPSLNSMETDDMRFTVDSTVIAWS